MSSIGRTLKPSSILAAFGLAGVLASVGTGYVLTQNILRNLEKNGTVEVSLGSLARLGQLTFRAAESSRVDVLLAEKDLEKKISDAREFALNEPKMKKARLKSSRRVIGRLFAKAPQAVEMDAVPTVDSLQEDLPRLDEVLPSTAVTSVDSVSEAEEMASESELLSIQLLHSQMHRQFLVAIQDLERFVESNERVAQTRPEPVPAPMTDDEYATARDAFLAAAQGHEIPVVEDEIDTSMSAPQRIARRNIRSMPEKPAVTVEKPAVVEEAKPVLTTTTAEPQLPSIPTADPDEILKMTTQPESPSVIRTEGIDPIPGMELDQPKVEKVKVTVAAATPVKQLPKKLKPAPVTPPAARLVSPEEPAPQVNTHAKRDLSNDDPTLDDNDYSFVDSQEDLLKPSEPIQSAPSQVTKKPANESNKKARTPQQDFRPAKRTSPIIVRNATSQRKVEPTGSAQKSSASSDVKGVVQDENGITIAWNEGADKGADFSASFSDQLVQKTSAPVQIPDPKRFCDSALMGVPAFTTVSPNELLSVCRRPLSLEGMIGGSQAKWWEVRESVDHWPTLILQKDKEAFEKSGHVPMLSTHVARALALFGKTKLQETSAIVLGELPAGLEVELLGRSEGILYFDSTFQHLERRDGARYFAYLNVAPGNPLLYVTLKNSKRGGSLPLVVRSGYVTYVKVPSPQARTLTARVLDSTSITKPKPVRGLSLRVIGQDGKSGVTDSKGEVRLNDVLTFGDYPIYVDVAPNERSFKHRYRLSASSMRDRDLFYFNEKTVQGWVSQLEGGISPLSGMVVGAFASLPSKEKEAYVRLQNLERRAALNPEMYILGTEDRLMTTPKVSEDYRRFIGVQIPEGTQIPSALKEDGTVLYSEIIIAQPGVINVLSP